MIKLIDVKSWINHSKHFFTVDLAFEFYTPLGEHLVTVQDWVDTLILSASSPIQERIILLFLFSCYNSRCIQRGIGVTGSCLCVVGGSAHVISVAFPYLSDMSH